MTRLCLFFVGVFCLTTAEIPCRLYDVTTIIRFNKRASVRDTGVSAVSQYEVHSRSNAVGLPMDFQLPAWYTAFKDPLQNSMFSNNFGTSSQRPGWITSGFKSSKWFEDDPFLNWEAPTKEIRIEDSERVEVNGVFQDKWLLLYNLGKNQAIKVRFRLGSGRKLFIGVTNYDEKIISGSGDGNIKSDDEDDDGDREGAKVSVGFEFTYLSNSSTMYQGKRYEKRFLFSSYQETSINNYDGIVQLPTPDSVVTVYVARNEQHDLCLWIENTNHPRYRHKKCLLVLSERDAVMLLLDANGDRSWFDVYRANIESEAIRQTANLAHIITLESRSRQKASCISLRYFLKDGDTARFRFLPVVNNTIHAEMSTAHVKGTGKPTSQEFQFHVPKELRKEKWKLRIEFVCNGTFIIRSARLCSGKGRDDVIVPFKLSEYEREGSTLLRDEFGHTDTLSKAVRALTPESGLGLKCAHKEIPTKTELTKCRNGGINIDGWCQCFPGFNGTSCETACPPERYGVDCSGSCNSLGKRDCIGARLAAPGSKFHCARGYHGPDCDKKCQNGYYGPDCLLECGHCAAVTCNRYSGLCDGPCQSGFAGRSCDLEVPPVYRPVITSRGFDTADGYLNITLSDEVLSSYPFIEIRYKHLQWPFKVSKKLLPRVSRNPMFHIEHLKPGQEYQVYAVLVHEGGSMYDGAVADMDTTHIVTDCNDGSMFTDVNVLSEGETLVISWKVTENDTNACPKVKFSIEIDSPELHEPILEYAEASQSSKTIESLLPNEGTVRIKAVYPTKEGEWSDTYEFSSSIVTEKPSILKVTNKTSTSIDFLWSKSDGALEDTIKCEAEAMVCRGVSRGVINETIHEGAFQLKSLAPFSVYSCTLENDNTSVSAITEQDLPSGAPKRLASPVKWVKNSSVALQWLGPNCFDINGFRKGFRVELFLEDKIVQHSEISDDEHLNEDEHSYEFQHLKPESDYEAHVFVLNGVGFNREHFLNITFKTKSDNSEAVRSLLVYKRSRTDLWLRWLEPEDFFSFSKTQQGAEDFQVVASTPGLESKVDVILPVPCRTWQDYYCHRLRGLVPNKDYTILVISRDSAYQYGPYAEVNATTKEGVPDPPEKLHVLNKTAHSAVVSWEIPVMLNSNPKHFIVSTEISRDSDSQESDDLFTRIPISDDVHLYQAKLNTLVPASTYTVTVSAGVKGERASSIFHTPPVDPPPPPPPKFEAGVEVIVQGIDDADTKYLRGYLLLVSSSDNVKEDPDIFAEELKNILQEKFTKNFNLVAEFEPTLHVNTTTFLEPTSTRGIFGLIDKKTFSPDVCYYFVLVAVSDYLGAYSASVSETLEINTGILTCATV